LLFHAYEVSKKLLSDYEVVILYLNVTVSFINRFLSEYTSLIILF